MKFCILYKNAFSNVWQEELEELKLAYGDSVENVASLQGCHTHQSDSVQTLGRDA